MKFQNPSLNSVLNGRKDGRMNERTHKPKPICSPLFQSWGHKKWGVRGCSFHGHFCMMSDKNFKSTSSNIYLRTY